VTIDKFDLNLVLVNMNKLKPYKFVGDQTFQRVLIKPNDFLPKELVETNHSSNPFIEESVKFHVRGLIANNLIEKEPIIFSPTKNWLKKVLLAYWKNK